MLNKLDKCIEYVLNSFTLVRRNPPIIGCDTLALLLVRSSNVDPHVDIELVFTNVGEIVTAPIQSSCRILV
jgi:hypothetical protein